MPIKYHRRKSTARSGPNNGHQYTTLVVYNGQHGTALSWSARHRKNCETCLRDSMGLPPTQPITADLDEWIKIAGHAVYLTSCYLKSAFEASERGDHKQAQELLVRSSRTITGIPISPDNGDTAEMLCKAGDFLWDASHALSIGDSVGASDLIEQSSTQIKRYTQSLPQLKENSHAA